MHKSRSPSREVPTFSESLRMFSRNPENPTQPKPKLVKNKNKIISEPQQANQIHSTTNSSRNQERSKTKRLSFLQTKRTPFQTLLIRAISTFLVTFLISLNYNKLAIEATWIIAAPASFVVASICTILVMFSIQIRAILLISFPEVFSRSGLIIATTILYWLAATGPMKNIVHNLKEVSGMISCTQNLVRIQQDQFTQVIKKANDESVRVLVEALKKPFEFGSLVERGVGTAADAIREVIPSLEEVLTELHDLFKVSLDITKDRSSSMSSTLNLTAIKIKIKDEINEKFEHLKLIRIVLKCLILLTPLILVIKAWKFHRSFVKDKKLGGLNQREIQGCKQKKTKVNWALALKTSMISILVPMLTFSPVLMFDFALSKSLQWVKENTNGGFTVEGSLDFRSKIKGGAIMKPLFEAFLSNVELKSKYTFDSDNSNCMPDPVESTTLTVMVAFGVIIVVMGGLSLFGQYFLAFRNRILDWVYSA